MHGLRGQGNKVKLTVRVLNVRDRVGLERMDKVGEFDGVSDEEDFQVVADQVPVAVLGVKLDRESAWVAQGLRGCAAVNDRGKPDKSGSALALFLKQLRTGVFGDRLVPDGSIGFEVAVCACAAGMDNALRDALPVEVGDLLDKRIVFQRHRSPAADRARVLVVVNRMPLPGGQHRLLIGRLTGSLLIMPVLAIGAGFAHRC